jgi:antitoxin component YwqK of YwqJK toxin-antitoxin module
MPKIKLLTITGCGWLVCTWLCGDAMAIGPDDLEPIIPVNVEELFADEKVEAGVPQAARAKLELPEISTPTTVVETVVERDDQGHPKIEKSVERTSSGDFVEHGPWREFLPDGTIVTSGRYEHGQRAGHWIHKLANERLPSSTALIADGFVGPFQSEVEYRGDKPTGTWRVSDSQCAIVLEVELVDGVRHGRTTYYYPRGGKRSEANYIRGRLHGTLAKLSADAKSAQEKTILWGRQPQTKQIRDEAGHVISEQSWLAGETIIAEGDDPLSGKLATFAQHDNPVKHGEWIGYDAEGHVIWRCQYVLGELDGPATWYYANGQKRITGTYAAGKPVNTWTWWHASGMRSIEGNFEEGSANGEWLAWNNSGKILGRRQLKASGEIITRKPNDRVETPTRDARLELPGSSDSKRLK